MPEVISPARSPSDYQAFAGLVADYVAWCRMRYAHDEWFVERVFAHQDLDREIRELPVIYGPPQGSTLLARRAGVVCGAGAYRRLEDGSCEMKRLFVLAAFKGLGLGRRLAQALIDAARAEGYALMRLDTGNLLSEAIALYQSMGFRHCAPHRPYPPELLPYLVFLELPLYPMGVNA
jgi:GNAT superfamily N-acetyltransferase